MKSRKITVTITLTEAAISALNVLSTLDMRSKSQEIEYLIIEAVERRNLEQEAMKSAKSDNDSTPLITNELNQVTSPNNSTTFYANGTPV